MHSRFLKIYFNIILTSASWLFFALRFPMVFISQPQWHLVWLPVNLSSSLCIFLQPVLLSLFCQNRSAVVCISFPTEIEWDPHKLYCCIFACSVFEVWWWRTARHSPAAFHYYFVRPSVGRGAQCHQDRLCFQWPQANKFLTTSLPFMSRFLRTLLK